MEKCENSESVTSKIKTNKNDCYNSECKNTIKNISENTTHRQHIICCIGMCVLDIIHVCPTYPVEDTDKRCISGYMQRGGNASNMCTVLRELGYSEIEFLGMMSTANGFEFLRSDCNRRDIIYKNCPTVTQNPPFSSVILVQNSDSRTIIHSNSNFPIFEYEHFKKLLVNQNLSNYDWIHFEGRNPIETLKIQHEILEHNEYTSSPIIISVEFEKILEENLILSLAADYIFLGKDLACHMGWHDPQAAVYGLRTWILKTQTDTNKQKSSHAKKSAIICAWGSIGAASLDANDHYALSPAQPPENIVDALGAGDTFCAATIYALKALKWQLKASVDFGNYCAGVKLGQYGYDGLDKKVKAYISKGN